MEKLSLRNNVEVPVMGLGTWKITDRELMKEVLSKAVDLGITLIDTAAAYSNEMAIGRALKDLGISREKLFIQDKLWVSNLGYESAIEACRKSIKKLKVDYLDAYFIHWPASPKIYDNADEVNLETWRALEDLYREGLVRSIGVCNFRVHHLENIMDNCTVEPMINQIEFHPGMTQDQVVSYCRKNNIALEASSPLGSGSLLSNNVLCDMARKNGVSPAVLCLAWEISRGISVIPKSSNPERIAQNLEALNLSLSEEDSSALMSLEFSGGLAIDPDQITQSTLDQWNLDSMSR